MTPIRKESVSYAAAIDELIAHAAMSSLAVIERELRDHAQEELDDDHVGRSMKFAIAAGKVAAARRTVELLTQGELPE